MTLEQAKDNGGKRRMQELAPYFAVVVLGLLLGSVFLNIFKGDTKKAGVTWEVYSETALKVALAQKKTVMIYFSADWCGPCHKLRRETFTDLDVQAEAQRFVRFNVDLTSPEGEMAKVGQKYAVMALPTVMFMDGNGEERTRVRLVGFEEAARFRQRMQAVK
ncbi:MAG TPA: thioredoxin family protein [Verrucomicrobiae bacterium]